MDTGIGWCLLVSAGFAVLCWFCAGPTENASTLFKALCWNRKKIYTYNLPRCILGHILDVRPQPLSRRTRPSTTPSVAELNHQNVCTAEDANSTLSGRCEPSGGRSRAISRRRLGFAHTKIAPVAQRLPSGRVLVPAWGAVAQGSARGLGALYVGAALSLLGRLGKYFCTMAFATFAFAALGKLLDKFCRAFAPLLS